ncbi:ABC transporter substrate-binding protein [Deinococcus radiotolerans]|uniref:Sugar ABC transporter substrate-binding protein n=1 Tax=Deinococcus radiotolerans TaxID=1309407 RepID=A0ABQ2FQS0_9DEIO|nr:sugar ABC transporter substrate-binding protein [Deinococcus radiotolerans]GGL17723.1 sugar ABC transporter substrate-binding protein [Deinococcus radiotolerans]
MKRLLTLTAALATTFASTASAATTLEYWLWDANQQPAYAQCAANFTKKNPDITIKITQKGWGDYWTGLTTGFVSGTAPDVFTNHLAYYPEFASNNQLVDLTPYIKRDKVPTTIYYKGLADLWVKGGKRYGLPKDFDTVGIFYNADLLAKAGMKPSDLANLTWNPKDGGTWQKAIARLTVDSKGQNGLSASFNKGQVKQYGYLTGYGAGFNGQTEWSFYTAPMGWTHNNGLFGTKYNYDDPRFAQAIQWLADLNLKYGLIPSFKDVQSSGDGLFRSGQAAMVINGSWMISDFTQKLPFKVGIAPLPKGPNGKRMSMFNGLSDAIWVGSKNKEAAWQWVKYLASADCQNVIGRSGVVFPAIPSATALAVATDKARGVDVSSFVNQAKAPGGTFYFPITDNAAQVNDIMTSALQRVFLGQAKASDVLPAANAKVNALFK